MKKIVYILALASLMACTSNKQETAQQNYTATPNGLADLQKTSAANTTLASAKGVESNLLVNPAHGEPGHDCSIAVGAPLKANARANVAPSTPQPTMQTVTPTAANISGNVLPAASANITGQKLNPAHGQPNHRCDIAVGAPLNSKPIQGAAVPAKPTVTAAKPASNPVATVNAKGQKLNPAHGQPGHKCEVAVGAPLS